MGHKGLVINADNLLVLPFQSGLLDFHNHNTGPGSTLGALTWTRQEMSDDLTTASDFIYPVPITKHILIQIVAEIFGESTKIIPHSSRGHNSKFLSFN